MGYEGLQASSWVTVILYLLIAPFFGGVSRWYYQEITIGDFNTDTILGVVIIAPIFFIGGIGAVWWGVGAAITSGSVMGVVISERLSNF